MTNITHDAGFKREAYTKTGLVLGELVVLSADAGATPWVHQTTSLESAIIVFDLVDAEGNITATASHSLNALRNCMDAKTMASIIWDEWQRELTQQDVGFRKKST